MYIYDLATIIPLIIATYYEKYTWVKWKIEINNTDNIRNFLYHRMNPVSSNYRSC